MLAVTLAGMVLCPRVSAQTVTPGPAPANGGASSSESSGAPRSSGQKGVDEGIFPKSIRIPGTDVSFGIGGYVKVDFIQDFSAIGDQFEFKTNTIPAKGTAAAAQSGQTNIHARETRVNLDVRSASTPAKG